MDIQTIGREEIGNAWMKGLRGEWRKIVLFFSLLLVTLFSFLFYNAHESRRFNDFFEASLDYGKIKGGERIPLESVEALIAKHPELKPLFSRYLQQIRLLDGEVDRAKREAFEAGGRLLDLEPFYHNYTEASFLIEEGKYEEALAEALALKAKLGDGKEESLYSLYLFNLIRIGYLNKCLGNEALAEEFIETAKTFLEENKEKEVVKELASHLSFERTNLFDFVHSP